MQRSGIDTITDPGYQWENKKLTVAGFQNLIEASFNTFAIRADPDQLLVFVAEHGELEYKKKKLIRARLRPKFKHILFFY